jgi:hypothetical protein
MQFTGIALFAAFLAPSVQPVTDPNPSGKPQFRLTSRRACKDSGAPKPITNKDGLSRVGANVASRGCAINVRAATIATSFSLGFAAGAFAHDCGPSAMRLAEGDWAGTYHKEIMLQGSSINTRVDYKFHGTIRLHVTDHGSVETLQGELVANIAHSAGGDDASQSSQSGFSTPLALTGEQNSSQHFRAVGSASLSTHNALAGPNEKRDFDYNISGPTQLDFHLLAASCDRGSGTFDSPLFRGIREMAPRNRLAIANDTDGTWAVTTVDAPDGPKQIKARNDP